MIITDLNLIALVDVRFAVSSYSLNPHLAPCIKPIEPIPVVDILLIFALCSHQTNNDLFDREAINLDGVGVVCVENKGLFETNMCEGGKFWIV